ncbi:BMP family ABC transporter substrate-binding protein [Dubosiella newyorkensis]|uniref:BMP family ABC transporter substrate-binding protein n=1 Tax=Dubosiella newyorkensis TaxID=1862672 RepID=UPI0023550864|nr:BMP family ABC transporter substrate-binding protein [Dubosiella newyorkensis]MCI9040795.1 BMP family ABC transporter substrate-binding protein [Dubosiella newyorkensis]
MSIEAADAYAEARKAGKKEEAEGKGLPVLDQILQDPSEYAKERIGIREIPLEQIVGTKTEGRKGAMTGQFLPLLKEDSEFANKWMRLYDAQIEEGLRDPIKVYEYYHQYYVEEGNKRVSVMKFLGGNSIMADVTRILPKKEKTQKSQAYYAYLDFIREHHLDFIDFPKKEEYSQLEKLLSLGKEERMNREKERQIKAEYELFKKAFAQIKDEGMHLSVGEAFLLYLETYGLEGFTEKSRLELEKELLRIQADLRAFPKKLEAKIETQPLDKELKKRILLKPKVNVGFIYVKDEMRSAWTKLHLEGQEYVKHLMPEEVYTKSYFDANTLEEQISQIEKAIEDRAQVVFTTSPIMLRASIMMAAKYPKVQILNCSLNTRTGHLRTYFARNFEVQFLNGMIAGILSESDELGYIADYPFYGMISNINAFALGAKMVNPRARVFLDWSTAKQTLQTGHEIKNVDITYIAGEEFNTELNSPKMFGLYDLSKQRFMNLATRKYYWGEFYKQLLTSILNGSFRLIERHGNESINYWWGLSNGMLDLYLKDSLPKQTRRLIEVMKEHMSEGGFNLFSTEMKDQKGRIRNHENESMSLQEIADMDWLLENVVGKIPKLSDFTEEAQELIAQYGIYSLQEGSVDHGIEDPSDQR